MSVLPLPVPHLLLVEDDERIAEPLCFGLEGEGFRVTHAATGPRGLELARTQSPDLVLLDVKLPDGNGLDLLPIIKKRWPETEVIILTGAPDDQEAVSWAVEATKRGAFNFVRKSAQLDFEKLLADDRTLAKVKGEKPVTVADLSNALEKKFFHGAERAAQEKKINRRKDQTLEEILNKRVTIKDAGSTNGTERYIYWKDFSAVFFFSDTHPSSLSDWNPDEDFIIAVNINGIAQRAWGALANQVIGSAYIQNLAVLGLKYESKSPVRTGISVGYGTDVYESVVAGKGAYILNMLQGMLGTAKFADLLHQYAKQAAGIGGTTAEFQKLAEQMWQRASKGANGAALLRQCLKEPQT